MSDALYPDMPPTPDIPCTRTVTGPARDALRAWVVVVFTRCRAVAPIARHLRRSPSLVEAVLTEAGVQYKGCSAVGACLDLTGAQRAALAEDMGRRYAAGESLYALSASSGRDRPTVRALVQDTGIAIRAAGQQNEVISGAAREDLAAALRRCYEQDPTLSVTALAATGPYTVHLVDRLLREAGATIRRPCSRGRRRYSAAAARDIGIGVRHLYLTGTRVPALARFLQHSPPVVYRALRCADVPVPALERDPARVITAQEAAAFGALLGPAYLDGATLQELAARLEDQPVALLCHALTAAGYPLRDTEAAPGAASARHSPPAQDPPPRGSLVCGQVP